MAFGNFRIGSYTLSRRIWTGSTRHAETLLNLRPDDEDSGPVTTALVYFVESPDAGEVSGGTVSAFLPADELTLWYEVLRTEDPVWFGWSSADADGAVELVRLSTGQEPPGEGLDLSP